MKAERKRQPKERRATVLKAGSKRKRKQRRRKSKVKIEGQGTRLEPQEAVDEIVLTGQMRTRAGAARQLVSSRERQSPAWNKIKKIIDDFKIPGGDDVYKCKGTTLAPWMDMFDDLMIGDFRAAPTWQRYHAPWLKARGFMMKHMKKRGHVWNVTTLAGHYEYVLASGMWVFKTNPSVSVVEIHFAAVHMALKVNGMVVPDSFYRSMLLDVCRRRRSKAAKKSAGLTLDEALQFNDKWGRSKCIVRRLVALFVCLAFQRCLRWSDCMVLTASAVYWMGNKGALICIPRRKNAQYTAEWFPLPDTGSESCVVRRLRALMLDLGFEVPRHGWGKEQRFIFPEFMSKHGATQEHQQTFMMGNSHFTCSKQAYPKWSRMFKKGLRQCCSKSEAQIKEYGLQSMRAGGDTLLWRKGVDAETRRDIGGWATSSVERGYLRKRLSDSLKFTKFYKF